jgi:hypothetical protein
LTAALEGWAALHAPRQPGGALSDEEIEVIEDMKRRYPD